MCWRTQSKIFSSISSLRWHIGYILSGVSSRFMDISVRNLCSRSTRITDKNVIVEICWQIYPCLSDHFLFRQASQCTAIAWIGTVRIVRYCYNGRSNARYTLWRNSNRGTATERIPTISPEINVAKRRLWCTSSLMVNTMFQYQ